MNCRRVVVVVVVSLMGGGGGGSRSGSRGSSSHGERLPHDSRLDRVLVRGLNN